jgi:thioredoxin-dependent peroxiredoxin
MAISRLTKVQALAALALPLIWGAGALLAYSAVEPAAPAVGTAAPQFRLQDQAGAWHDSSEYRGKWLVLYFYPKDDTPGCTTQACGFRDSAAAYKKLKAQVVGISKDSVARHDKFKAKYQLNFPLVSDEDGKICEKYGTWIEKSLYGRKYMGIDRATFLIDPKGIVRGIWHKVKVDGHVDAVLKAAQAL